MKELKDRKTLKGYFKKGSIPTEEQFAALIDSVPNIAEDGQAARSGTRRRKRTGTCTRARTRAATGGGRLYHPRR